MSEYTVTFRLTDRNAFVHFIETVGPAVGTMTVTVRPSENPMATLAEEVKVSTPRAPRGSKVNDVILEALGGGARTVKQLKEALEGAELSAGSLSTGLATLQRSMQIKRIEDGLYGLSVAEAA